MSGLQGLVTTLGAAALLAACGGGTSETPSPATPLGVKECDDYLARYEACVKTAPADQRASMAKSLEAQRKALPLVLGKPNGRAEVVLICQALAEALAKNPDCKP